MGTTVFSMLYDHSHSACPTVTQLPRRQFISSMPCSHSSPQRSSLHTPHLCLDSPLPHAMLPQRGWTWGNQSGSGAPMSGWEEFQGTPRG